MGTSLTTSSDVPAIDCVYKLQEYAGLPRRKWSSKKATWPGRKQVWRRYDAEGRMAGDLISVDDAAAPAKTGGGYEPLVHCVMRNGRRLAPSPSLDEIRQRAKREMERLPEPLRRLDGHASYPVEVADDLIKLAAEVDSRIRRR